MLPLPLLPLLPLLTVVVVVVLCCRCVFDASFGLSALLETVGFYITQVSGQAEERVERDFLRGGHLTFAPKSFDFYFRSTLLFLSRNNSRLPSKREEGRQPIATLCLPPVEKKSRPYLLGFAAPFHVSEVLLL